MYQEELYIRFAIKIGDTFWSEHQIGAQIDTLLANDTRQAIDLRWPDGAVSIRYWGQELLGEACWDYLMDLVESVRAALPGLLRAERARVPLHVSGCVLTLVPRGDRLALELSRGAANGAQRHVLPLQQFVREWELMYWRLEKTRATFSGGSFGTGLQQWHGSVDAALGDIVSADQIAAIVEQPLAIVLRLSTDDAAEPSQ